MQTEPHNPATKDQQPQLFPDNIHGIQDTKITSIELTPDFFIFSTDVSAKRNFFNLIFGEEKVFRNFVQLGNLVLFSLEYWTMVTNYRHSSGIRSIFAGADGGKLIFMDDHNQGYVYCAVITHTIDSIGSD